MGNGVNISDVPDPQAGPIPLATLRDLLGIVRALFVLWSSNGQGPIEMEEIRGIGADLREAYRLARHSKPGGNAHRAAWLKAERATRELADIIGDFETIKGLVSSTSHRLGFKHHGAFDPNRRHRERVKRG
jgi:hypothetical protein